MDKRKEILLKYRKEIIDDLNDFYERLPNMNSIDIISEYQQKVKNLIDYIIELEKDIVHMNE